MVGLKRAQYQPKLEQNRRQDIFGSDGYYIFTNTTSTKLQLTVQNMIYSS